MSFYGSGLNGCGLNGSGIGGYKLQACVRERWVAVVRIQKGSC